mmetsp:Transcript_29313/g.49237  ORF Transcript_29313/g.49237 Transcript_29313/m.49237 type:complete len:434 (+) Transcript_29313:139-1440(+)|eukprot:CAMPEP_0198214040 /NCGR_PEP_ID=MMETSP1445-20131203/36781_1 /TAXON_ID=36898 /ORGANISM="Pyramimonas sp., Strain CCMP2087" /LENGTH=433 /DNA_ID=CAMNT_0043888993 /DNA_START=116 /DNA_END=1417 /DNA_ORIENTATION=+
MAKVTEYSDSDDEAEAKEREEKEKRSMLNEKGEQMDFTEMMKKAAEMKTAQLKEKRRQWDATPDWYKNTMVHERSGEVKDIREGEAIDKRLEAAVKFKDEGNEFYSNGKLDKAVDSYVKSVALFRLWRRKDDNQEIWFERGDEQLTQPERQKAEKVLVTCFTNIAQVFVKKKKWYEASYACTQALELDPDHVKALYRRALARVAEDTSTTLELAVKDLRHAAKVDPDDIEIREALRKYGTEMREQRTKDEKIYGGMFSKGELYTQAEQERIKAPQKSVKSQDPIMDMPDEEFKKHAKMAGIDLDDPNTRKVLEKKVKDQRDKDLKDKAGAMGINLDDPEVKKVLELLEKQHELEELKKKLGPTPAWKQWMLWALDTSRPVNLQRILYFLIFLNVAYKIYRMYSQTGFGAQQAFKRDESEEWGASVWDSSNDEL